MDDDGQEVRIYVKDGEDDYELLMTADIEYFGGVLPVVGDLFSAWSTFSDQTTFQVIERHVVEDPRPKWALIVQEVPGSISKSNWRARWIEDSAWLYEPFPGAVEEIEPQTERWDRYKKEKLERNNRDLEYWTEERKQILKAERDARLAAIKAGREPED